MVFKWSVRRVQFAFDPVLIRVSLIRGLSYSRFVQFDVLLCKSPKSYRAPHRYSDWRCHGNIFLIFVYWYFFFISHYFAILILYLNSFKLRCVFLFISQIPLQILHFFRFIFIIPSHIFFLVCLKPTN